MYYHHLHNIPLVRLQNTLGFITSVWPFCSLVTPSWWTPSSHQRLPSPCVSSRSPPSKAFHVSMLHVVPVGGPFLPAVYLKGRGSQRERERLFPPLLLFLCLCPVVHSSSSFLQMAQSLHGLLKSRVVIVLCSAGSWIAMPRAESGHLHLCSLITNNNLECICWGKEAWDVIHWCYF